MAQKTALTKILNHPDKSEIIDKLTMDAPPKEICEWLRTKYSSVSENRFVLSETSLKTFKEIYFNVYRSIEEDILKTKTALVAGTPTEQLQLSVSNSKSYQELIMQTVEQEVDLKKALRGLVLVVETRLGQIYDVIQQNPGEINRKGFDRLFFEAVDSFGGVIDRANKIINQAPDQIIQHNISVQHIDQHTTVFYEAIKRCLAKMDLAQSMAFMEIFNEEMSKLKDPTNSPIRPVEERLAEVKVLNEAIHQRINS